MLITPQDYRNNFDNLLTTADNLLSETKPTHLKKDELGVVAWNLNGARMPISEALERNMEQKLIYGQSMSFFDLLEKYNPENSTQEELFQLLNCLKNQSSEVKKQFETQAKIAKASRNSPRNFFELDPSNPKKFLQQANKILNPEEAQDFLLMVIYQTWADITNSPKIPIFDFYVDIFEKIGALEANPLSANSYSKAVLNEKLIAEGSTPFRSNALQEAAMKYNRFIGIPKGCKGLLNPDGSVLVIEQDIYFRIKIPSLSRFLSGTGREREFSLAEIAMKARMAMVVELAVEKGFSHALMNHTGGFSRLLDFFRDLTGISNPARGKPAHH
jgi:hypothetical protein